jgi:glycosyltransferase involved in cell wall biosynthesis
LYLPVKKAQPYGGRATTIERTIHLLKRAAVFYSLAHDADMIWVETEDCKQELQKLLEKKKVVVIPNEVNIVFKHTQNAPKQAGEPFEWLFPAAGYPHKNFALLRSMLQKLPADAAHRFSVTLPAADFESYFSDQQHHPALRNLGAVSPEQLAQHYTRADGIFLPSMAEIFSATWLESFATGRPLLCADIPSARAICGNAAHYFDGHSVPSALKALDQLAGDKRLQQKLVLAGTERLAHFCKGASRADQLFEKLLQTTQNIKRHP